MKSQYLYLLASVLTTLFEAYSEQEIMHHVPFDAVQRCSQGNAMQSLFSAHRKQNPSVYSISQFFAAKRWPLHMIIIISPSSLRHMRTLSTSLMFQFGVIGCCYDELKKIFLRICPSAMNGD